MLYGKCPDHGERGVKIGSGSGDRSQDLNKPTIGCVDFDDFIWLICWEVIESCEVCLDCLCERGMREED